MILVCMSQCVCETPDIGLPTFLFTRLTFTTTITKRFDHLKALMLVLALACSDVDS